MRSLNICLLFDRLEPRHIEQMQSVAEGARFLQTSRDEAARHLAQAEVAFGWPRSEHLAGATHLRWLQLPSAGAERYLKVPALRERRVIVTNCSGVFGIPIAEHVLGLMLMLVRRLHHCVRSQGKGQWEPPPDPDELHGKTAGILGLGDIGTAVARRAKAFGMRVVAARRMPGAPPEFVDELHGPEGIDRVVEQADYLILCLPRTPETDGLLSRERLARMKAGSCVINVGRGALIDEPALIEALRASHLAGAGLDVFVEEPLPPDSPLWAMDNVIITPHIAGTHRAHADRATAVFCRNLQRFLRGEPLENVVDVTRGY